VPGVVCRESDGDLHRNRRCSASQGAQNGGSMPSSYLNLVPFRYVFITSNALSDYHYSAPNSYSSSIIKKVLCTEQLGGIINDNQAVHHEDFIDVGGKNLKRLDFRITDETGKVMNLYDIPVQFALLLSHPSY
jgi:hypothetical protein